jgi:hypothetical protein
MLEGGEPRTEDAGLVQDLKGSLSACDVKLVAGAAVECASTVRPDLRVDSERPEQAERTAGNGRVDDVEMDRQLATSFEVDAPGRVKEARQLRKPVAGASRRDGRELMAEIFRE